MATTNCPNCGAPVSSFECPYCGTAFLDFCTVDMDRPFVMRVRASDGKVYKFKALMPLMNVDMRQEFAEYTELDGMTVRMPTAVRTTVRAEFEVLDGFRAVV